MLDSKWLLLKNNCLGRWWWKISLAGSRSNPNPVSRSFRVKHKNQTWPRDLNTTLHVFLCAYLNPSQPVVGSDPVESLFIRVALLALSDTRFRSLSSSSPEPPTLQESCPPGSACGSLHSPVCKSQALRGGRSWAGCRFRPAGLDGYPSYARLVGGRVS